MAVAGVDAIEKARSVSWLAERFDTIAVRLALFLDHFDDFLFQVVRRLRFGTFQQQHAKIRARRHASGGATMAVRIREVAQGLAANEVIRERAVFDGIDGLSFHALAIEHVAADKAFALEVLERGVVHDGEKIRQHARFVTGGKCAGRAVRAAKGRLVTDDILADERGDDVVGGISGEQDGAAILFFDNGGLTQRDDGIEHFLCVGHQQIA